MKKLISVLLTLICLCAFLGIQSFAAERTDPNYLYLRSCGYPDSFLDEVSADYLAKTIEAIGDSAVSKAKIADMNSSESPYGNKVDYVLITAELTDKNSGHMVGQIVNVYWKWNESRSPIIRGEDHIWLWWNPDDFMIVNPFYMEDYSKKNANDKWSVSKTRDLHAVQIYGPKDGKANADTVLPKSGKYIGGAFVAKLEVTDTTKDSYDGQIHIAYDHIVKDMLTIYVIIAAALLIVVAVIVIIVKVRKKKKQTQ